MKRLLSTISLTACILMSTSSLTAGDRPLKLRSGELTINATTPTTQLSFIEKSLDNNYVIVQFNQVPTNKEKATLLLNGVTLLEYLPLDAFIVELKNTSNLTVADLNIRAITPFLPKYKLSKAVAAQDFPEWATNGNEVDLMVEPHLNLDASSFESILTSNNIEILNRDPSGLYYEIRMSKDGIGSLSLLPSVKAIDFIPAPPEKEDTRGRTLHRANMLDSDHPLGRKYDGSGVSIAIADDAVIGPHIDIKGRVTSFSVNPNGSHGDMTSGIAMGAGNLNPDYRGMATGAYLYYYDIGTYPHISNAVSNLNTRGVVITSTSFSEGCNAGYTSTTRVVDQQTRQNPALLHVFSAGNSAAANCGYGAGTPWGTITGGRKQGKATIATGNLTYNSILTQSSSRGPAEDGRIKPDICANGTNQMSINANNTYQVGGGTSAAAPGIAGLAAQMYQGYRALHGGVNPESGLIKAAMLNTAHDLGNPGPDFNYGWGRVNAHRAMLLIEDDRFLDSNVSQGNVNTHSISIPANIGELNFMVYWTDYEASTVAARALVNNLDFKVVTPAGDTVLPWVLDPTPTPALLNSNATRGLDDLNNMEQVSIDSVAQGNYTLIVEGTTVPQGPQKYYIVWETRRDEIEVTYPHGSEAFTPGTTETIRWDAVGNSGATIIEYSTDNGSTWNSVAVTNGAARSRDWIVPSTITGDALIRVTKGSVIGTSANTFSIIGVPTNIRTNYRCPDSIQLTWNSVAGATGYEVSILGATHMDSVGRTNTNTFVLKNLSLSDDNWVSVKAIGNGIVGKRANAVVLPKTIDNCPFSYDVDVAQFTSPSGGFVLNCNASKSPIGIRIINNGDSNLTDIPLRLTHNGLTYHDTLRGPLASGSSINFTFTDSLNTSGVSTANISVISDFALDQNKDNDSLGLSFDIVNTSFTLPYANDFESFTICSIATNCGGTVCDLNGGWYNATNGEDDDFDMRVDRNGTASNGTGPSVDHNPGNSVGRYIYSEASNGCTVASSQTISPCFDLSGTTNPEFSFWYHMNGTSVGNIRVDVFSNGTWTNAVIPAIVGSQGNQWLQQTINLSAYAGQVINVRFTVTTGVSWSSDIAIDDVSFVDQVTTGIENISTAEGFTVYPNPSEGVFNIQFNELPKNIVQLIDMNGRVVEELRIQSNSSQLDLSNYPKGVYFLSIQNTSIREKLIVY